MENHSQEDQQEGPSLDGKMMSGMIWRRWSLWSELEQVQDRLKWKDIVEKAKTLPEL